MTVIDFINFFNVIKPTLKEIKQSESSVSEETASEIIKDYDLQLTSLEIYDDLLIDILLNTNLCELYFSPFLFSKSINNSKEFKIGSIIEKGVLFFNTQSHSVIFRGNDNGANSGEMQISQNEFVDFLLKYWEFDFNRIYRNNLQPKLISGISVNGERTKIFSVFEELLDEIGVKITDLE